MIPVCDLRQQYLSLKGEIDAAMQDAAFQTKYILGPNVKQLEKDVAAFCQCKHGVGVNSGTDALTLALRALDLGPGDEVITTPFTFVATTEAIGAVGATPVFADIDPLTFNIDPEAVAQAITPRTKAILPVHLFGQPCDMDRLVELAARHGLYLVEDCAQSYGATWRDRKVGSFGQAGCLSFFPSKNLGGFGDGGMVVTNDDRVAQRVETLRRHGGKIKYHHDELGLNSRLDELQAAILRVKFPHVAGWNAARRRLACRYNALLADAPDLVRPHEAGPRGPFVPTAGRPNEANDLLGAVYHQYTILVADRDGLGERLTAAGIGNAVYYPVPLHLQKVHAHLRQGPGSFAVAERVAKRCLSLPMFPELTEEQQDEVVRAVRAGLEAGSLEAPLQQSA
jgi:dTDP-4-amino-4,6-dideoxygalactose transaminase